MKRAILLSLILCLHFSAAAQNIYPATAVLDTTLMELPSIKEDDNLVIHQAYISSFNPELRIPDWVAYELTSEELQGEAQRHGSFKQDRSLPLQQASNSDYTGTGYDKGHMAPAADMKWSEDVMSESFFFTNISPQKPKLNRIYWLQLEDMTRNAAQAHGSIWVISGTIAASDSLETIGKNHICVPTHFYKALLTYDGSDYASIAFLMDNTNEAQPVEGKALSVDELETILQLDLFKNLKGEAEQAECSYSLSFWGLEGNTILETKDPGITPTESIPDPELLKITYD